MSAASGSASDQNALKKNRYYLQLQTKFSVVIKVGMVGDSAIGKTSLMVKYVEGAFDEDYIQTLGRNTLRSNLQRRQFHGEDNQH